MTTELGVIDIFRRSGTEQFHHSGNPLGHSLLQFWQWAYSDLVSNTCRAVIAEFLVACDLGLYHGCRAPWHPYDFETATGIRIEVKSTGVLQRWQQKRLTPPTFNVPPTFAEDPVTAEFAKERKRQADVYVCALHAHADKRTLDPLDASQWRFFVISRRALDDALGVRKSLPLALLKKLGAREAAFGSIAPEIDAVFAPEPL